MKILKSIAIAFSLLCACACYEPSKIIENKVVNIETPVVERVASRNVTNLKVGFFAFDGYHEEDEEGHRSGYGYEFLQIMARYSDFTYSYVGYNQNWADMKNDLNLPSSDANHIDLVTSASKISGYTFSTHDIGMKSAILSVKSGNTTYSDGNYDGISVGLLSGSSGTNSKFSTFMAGKGYAYSSYEYSDVDDLKNYLQAGQDNEGHKIDAIVTSNLRKQTNEWVLEEIDPAPFYVMFKEGNTLLADEVDTAIDKMDSANPSWRNDLLQKYYSSDSGDEVAFTNEERNYLDELKTSGKVLKATFDPDYFPYCYFEDKKAKGIIPTIFAEIARRMGLNYEIVYCEKKADYRNLIYPQDDGSHQVDLVLDGVDDYYLAEQNGYKISDSYLSAEVSALRLKSFTGEIQKVAVPNYAVIAPTLSKLYKTKETVVCSSMDECASLVKSGKVDAAYLPNASARYYTRSDAENKLGYSIVAGYTRSYVISLSNDYSYLLISALNRSVSSLTDEYIAGVVAEGEDVEIKTGFVDFVYDYPWAIALLSVFLVLILLGTFFFFFVNHLRKKEKEKQKELSRFVTYICDSDETVAEVNIQDNVIHRYGVDGNNKMVVSEEKIPSLHQYNESRNNVLFENYYDVLTKELDNTGLIKLIKEGRPLYFEARGKCGDNVKWYSYLIQPVEQSKEHPLNFILYRRDIDATRQEEQKQKQVLSDALVNAESASAAKGSFLSKMSHEIRTPLNAIIGYINMAKEADGDQTKIVHYVDSSELAAKHLLSVINDVLDMSSIESGRMKIADEPFDIKVLLSTISSIYYAQAQSRKIDFKVVIKSLNYERFYGDSLRVNQVLMNLLSNSMKFTSDGGKITLTVKEKDGLKGTSNLTFEVKDTGKGMSKEFLSRIFTPFEQESSSTARLYGGSGLGLSITKNLVNLMGGSIKVKSQEGVGSEFTVTLPFKVDSSSLPREDNKPLDFSKLRALVVDDEENEREYAKSILERLKIKADVVSDGSSAISKILVREEGGHPYDFCLMDWHMPGEDGIEISKKIREQSSSKLPIIMLTAYEADAIRDEAKASGVNLVVSKPLFESTLFDLLVNMYGSYDKVEVQEKDDFSFAGVHVLLAEDNDMNLEIATDMLQKRGVNVTSARDGTQVVDLFLKSKPGTYQAILMDIQMPRMDGYEATKAIRVSSHPEAKNIPIIAMTADAFTSDVAACLASGMNDHVAKPIDKNRLFHVLGEQITRFRKGQ
jgi:signal transduction histidine kinase/CheY-like chemotaxis protein/ABC-type amino acid transport substrate-binding protein